jgi:hypothetical protein
MRGDTEVFFFGFIFGSILAWLIILIVGYFIVIPYREKLESFIIEKEMWSDFSDKPPKSKFGNEFWLKQMEASK